LQFFKGFASSRFCKEGASVRNGVPLPV
jgi:hypothetical protein